MTDTHIEVAKPANLSVLELSNLILDKKKEFLINTYRAKFSKAVTIKKIETGETLEFSSILAIVKYFKDQSIIVDRNKIAKILNTGEAYKGYIFIK